MTDKIINFYDKLNIKGNKLPKNWNKHHIMHNSMILAMVELEQARQTRY